MQNSVAPYDYMVEGPRMGRDELFIRIPRAKPRRTRDVASASSGKPGGVRQRRNKRWSW